MYSNFLNLPYVVERLPKPRKKKKPPLQGFCPFLRWLGLEKRVTPLVWSKIAEYGTMSHSFETARLTLKDWGIKISIRRIQSLTYSFCQAALSQRKSKVFHLKQGNLEKTNILKDKQDDQLDKKALEKEIKHLVKLQEADRINYPLIAQKKLPLGSGAIESLIRQAVNLRLKGNGKFWRKHNAEALLHARCQWLSRRWDDLIDSILTARICPEA